MTWKPLKLELRVNEIINNLNLYKKLKLKNNSLIFYEYLKVNRLY